VVSSKGGNEVADPAFDLFFLLVSIAQHKSGLPNQDSQSPDSATGQEHCRPERSSEQEPKDDKQALVSMASTV
jgi:hypothetical protein